MMGAREQTDESTSGTARHRRAAMARQDARRCP